jgi:hypothetical protein
MSFKEFSVTHNAPTEAKPQGKSKTAPPVDQPAAKTDKPPAKAASASKP